MMVDEVLDAYCLADRLAEEIITDKHEISDLDEKRNGAREAIRHLKRVSSTSKSSWICFGNTFIKMDTSDCLKMLERDHRNIASKIEGLHQDLKPKVAALQQLDGNETVEKFNLQAIKKEELFNIHQ